MKTPHDHQGRKQMKLHPTSRAVFFAAMGLLSLATPAGATPARVKNLSQNVTVKVIDVLPKVDRTMNVYREGDTANNARATVLAASTLPFDFILDNVSYGIPSRTFTTTKNKVCMDIAIHAVKNAGHAYRPFKVTLKEHVSEDDLLDKGSVDVPRDGVARSYCWSGTSRGKTYHFFYGFKGNGGDRDEEEYIDGSGRVRNP